MKKIMISYLLLLGLTPFLVQCVASEQDLRGVDLRTRTLDNRMSELERLNETVRAQAAAQARLGGDLGGISDRLLQHQGRMDEADHQRLRLQEQQQEGQRATSIRLDNIDITLKEMVGRLAGLSVSLADLQAQEQDNRRQIQEIQEQRAREAADRAAAAAAAARAAEQARKEAEERARREAEERVRREAAERVRVSQPTAPARGPREIVPEQLKQKVEAGRPSASDAAPESAPTAPPQTTARPATPLPTPAPPQAAAPTAKPGQEIYDQGRRQLQEKKYAEAYASLVRYLEQHPRGELAADARFLLGETLFQQQEFELAILEFQKLIADFPGHSRIPEALLRQGMAFEELREPSTAAIIYERLAGEFPRSSQAEQAREKLQKIR